jgi:hypothetical protein
MVWLLCAVLFYVCVNHVEIYTAAQEMEAFFIYIRLKSSVVGVGDGLGIVCDGRRWMMDHLYMIGDECRF